MTPFPFEDILVPLDGSQAAERALAPALELARRSGVPLRALARALQDDTEELTGYLAGLTDRCAADADVDTQIVDLESIPDAIAEGVAPGTLVCISSHGRGRSEALLGSITEALLRITGRPMLVVGPHVPRARRSTPGGSSWASTGPIWRSTAWGPRAPGRSHSGCRCGWHR